MITAKELYDILRSYHKIWSTYDEPELVEFRFEDDTKLNLYEIAESINKIVYGKNE